MMIQSFIAMVQCDLACSVQRRLRWIIRYDSRLWDSKLLAIVSVGYSLPYLLDAGLREAAGNWAGRAGGQWYWCPLPRWEDDTASERCLISWNIGLSQCPKTGTDWLYTFIIKYAFVHNQQKMCTIDKPSHFIYWKIPLLLLVNK